VRIISEVEESNHPVSVKWVVKWFDGKIIGNYGLVYPCQIRRLIPAKDVKDFRIVKMPG
jgi:hypothetical protein